MHDDGHIRLGLFFGFGAFGWWAFVVPVYFRILTGQGADPFEILAQRVLFGLPIMFVILLMVKQLRGFVKNVIRRENLILLIPSTVMIGINWYFFIYAVAVDRLSHAGLGYFINPVVSVALGYVFLGERMRRAQWVALAIGLGAVAMMAYAEITAEGGTLPWISLVLPCSFGLYGLFRKQAKVSAVEGLSFEMLALLPLALWLVVWLDRSGTGIFLSAPGWVTAMMCLGGVVTIVPLLFFTGAARRLPLKTIGMLQYLAPTFQTILAFMFFGERFTVFKGAAFGLIVVTIGVFTYDATRQIRRERAAD